VTRLLTVEEAASRISVNPETIRRMIRRGDLAALKVGNVYRVDQADLVPTRREPKLRPTRPETPLSRFVQPEWRHREGRG
jgi:excisionase family DNA binding protein